MKRHRHEEFVIELAGIYGFDESFLRALPTPTLEMWEMLVRDEAKRHQSTKEIMEKFRAELNELKFGNRDAGPVGATLEPEVTPDHIKQARSWRESIEIGREKESLTYILVLKALEALGTQGLDFLLASYAAAQSLSSPTQPQDYRCDVCGDILSESSSDATTIHFMPCSHSGLAPVQPVGSKER